jgi:hypothetical protein
MKRRRTAILLSTVATVAFGTTLLVTGALAANVHLKGGKRAEPKYNDNGLTLSGSADLAGLGNADVYITIEAQGEATSTCTNPSGSTQPPGQNPAEVTLTGGLSIPKEEIKNGSLKFSVTTEGPTSPIPGAPGCPNGNWFQDITDVEFSSAKITVEQPQGTVVLELTNTL